jgi:hypothetical protein
MDLASQGAFDERRTDMERFSIILAAGLMFGASALAQERAERAEPPSAAAQEVQLSDADLEKFADIYVDLLETVDKFEGELVKAQTEDETRLVQSRMQEESIAKVNRHGWTPEHYVAVGDAINSNRQLAEKTLALIEDRNN